MKNLTKILIPLVIILIALLVAENLYYLNKIRVPGALSLEEATVKAMDYINSIILQGQTTASLIEASEKSGVYELKLKIENQEYTSYVSKDGKFLFPQATELPGDSPELTTPEKVAPAETGISKKEDVKAQLFVMSYCPFGNQAEEIMMDVVRLLGGKADIELHYVIYSNYRGGGSNYCLDKENKYCSMHGIQELNQNIRELCVQKYQKDKLWDFIKEANAKCNAQNVDSCWEKAAGNAGVDVQMIKECQRDEALVLAEQDLQLNKKYGITGSPQLIINDVEYKGARSAEAYKQAICSGFNSPPEECSQILSGEAGAASGGCE
jgi:hypothetical protein